MVTKVARYLGLFGSVISLLSVGVFVIIAVTVYKATANNLSTALGIWYLLVAVAVIVACFWAAIGLEKHLLKSALCLGIVGTYSVVVAASYAFSSVQLQESLLIALYGFVGGLPLVVAAVLAVIGWVQATLRRN